MNERNNFSMYYNEITEVIECDQGIDLTWLEIQSIKRKYDDKIISKNLLICQGNKEDPSIIFLTKKDIIQLIYKLRKVLNKLN